MLVVLFKLSVETIVFLLLVDHLYRLFFLSRISRTVLFLSLFLLFSIDIKKDLSIHRHSLKSLNRPLRQRTTDLRHCLMLLESCE